MTFSILHTSARPEKWREVYEAWLKAADHPEDVEYVLCVDERWGFNLDDRTFRPGHLDKFVWNTFRRCYVDGVNLAAAASTGNILIVNADDQYPCEHWDTIILNALNSWVDKNVVIWANTLTPRERERKIMPMPILTRAYYRQKGYVLYPKYESMYADNDFCEQALHDETQGWCQVLLLDESYTFPHRHLCLDSTVKNDAVYAAQNRNEAYRTGAALCAARRANGFTEVADITAAAVTAAIPSGPADSPVDASTLPRRTVVLCLSGENFSAGWVSKLIELITQLPKFHHLKVLMTYSSNVYHTRIGLAELALKITPEVDYLVWVDDDNLVTTQQVLQLILDLECLPEKVGLVAGWTLTGSNYGGVGCELSCGNILPDSYAKVSFSLEGLNSGSDTLKEIGYTGFPLLAMRRSMLASLTEQAFCPYPVPNVVGVAGEDVSFCIRASAAGYKMYVDRRVLLPHLKMRDIAQHLQAQVIQSQFPGSDTAGDGANKDYHEKGMENANTGIDNAALARSLTLAAV